MSLVIAIIMVFCWFCEFYNFSVLLEMTQVLNISNFTPTEGSALVDSVLLIGDETKK